MCLCVCVCADELCAQIRLLCSCSAKLTCTVRHLISCASVTMLCCASKFTPGQIAAKSPSNPSPLSPSSSPAKSSSLNHISSCAGAQRTLASRKYFPYFSANSLLPLLLILCTMLRISDACSARSTPKPRPPLAENRPNITFQTFQCPEAYAKWYCLNGATCFYLRIGESILYNCECADGYMGQRCEFKDLDGSYLPSREKVLVETAKVAGGAFTVLVLFIFIAVICYTSYISKQQNKRLSNQMSNQLSFIT